MSNKKQLSVLFSLLIIPLIALVIYWQRLAIFDAWRLYNYEPPAEIVALADQTKMKQAARRLFYVYHPAILDKKLFNMYCRENEFTIVLGCYRSRMGIYIYDVQDERLDGIKQVTAAHEYLHAVYERLSSEEKKRVDALTDAVAKSLTSQRLIDTINLYKEKDARVVPNELHSILGTELRVLPKELEDYYAKHFSNRLAIVEFSEKYEKAFDEREKQIEAYDAQMNELKSQIETLKNSLDAEDNQLNAERVKVENSQSQSEVDAYNARVAKYNRDIDRVRTLVDQYNSILKLRNALVLEEKDLSKAIDSRDVVPGE